MYGNTDRDPRGLCPLVVAVAIVGGNCNNGSKCGARYLNVNNAASNARWNIGASLSYPINDSRRDRPSNNAAVFP